MRRYKKGDYVNVYSTSNQYMGIAKIIGWTYYPENQTHDYLVENIKIGLHATYEEGHLINFKINLARENPDRMKTFYEVLGRTKLSVIFHHDTEENTYTLVGDDLNKARQLFIAIVKDGKFRCPDCGHIHEGER